MSINHRYPQSLTIKATNLITSLIYYLHPSLQLFKLRIPNHIKISNLLFILILLWPIKFYYHNRIYRSSNLIKQLFFMQCLWLKSNNLMILLQLYHQMVLILWYSKLLHKLQLEQVKLLYMRLIVDKHFVLEMMMILICQIF